VRRANLIQKETDQISSVRDLTAVFEAIASTQIAKVKDKVEMAQEFFQLLWQRYSAIRIDPDSRITSRDKKPKNPRKVFVIISADSGLSGDIDQRLIEKVLKDYDKSMTDIIVLGSHGANQLNDRGIPYTHFFKVPESETYIDVSPIIEAVLPYSEITVYYEVYVSLGVQEIQTIDLVSTIQAMSKEAEDSDDIITPKDTIFEPSLDEIADLMEKGMMSLAFSQAILQSSLAQAASRFNAMAAAKKLAWELVAYHKLEYHRSKRSESDRRLREVLIGIKKKKNKRAKAQR
jgi:F-type H+-transporting ATPase subunit gamma